MSGEDSVLLTGNEQALISWLRNCGVAEQLGMVIDLQQSDIRRYREMLQECAGYLFDFGDEYGDHALYKRITAVLG